MCSDKWQPPSESLSKREQEILHLLSQGLSDREISERLIMTINTIKWYNRQIYNSLGVGSRTEAIARAHELGLLDFNTDPSDQPAKQEKPEIRLYLFGEPQLELNGVL